MSGQPETFAALKQWAPKAFPGVTVEYNPGLTAEIVALKNPNRLKASFQIGRIRDAWTVISSGGSWDRYECVARTESETDAVTGFIESLKIGEPSAWLRQASRENIPRRDEAWDRLMAKDWGLQWPPGNS